jgi:hypothetical protein
MKVITYTFSVTVTQEIDEDTGEDAYTNRDEIRYMEREIIQLLSDRFNARHLDGQIDAECMEHEIKEQN